MYNKACSSPQLFNVCRLPDGETHEHEQEIHFKSDFAAALLVTVQSGVFDCHMCP